MTDDNKDVVRRLVNEVMNAGDLDVIDDIYAPQLAAAARRWITPFREAFPDVHMDIVDLIAESDKVVGRFSCSGTHQGRWRGQAATGRRFHNIAEVYIFTIRDGRIVHAWGLEDTHNRMIQLGISPPKRQVRWPLGSQRVMPERLRRCTTGNAGNHAAEPRLPARGDRRGDLLAPPAARLDPAIRLGPFRCSYGLMGTCSRPLTVL